MKNRMIASLFALCLLTQGVAAMDLVGSLDELKISIENSIRPKYISTLMDVLAEKLQNLFHEQEIQSPRKMFAFFATMPAILSSIQETLQVVVGKSSWDEQGDTALKAVVAAVDPLGEEHNWAVTFNSTRSTAWNFISKNGRDAASSAFAQALGQNRQYYLSQKTAHSLIAEWGMLNYLITNCKDIIEPVYRNAINKLPEEIAGNPFVSYDEWLQSRAKFFGNLSAEALIFATPWLRLLDTNIILRDEAAFVENALPWLNDELSSTDLVYNHVRFMPGLNSILSLIEF